MADKYIRAGALAEQFRDMAEFADGVQAVALREAADAVDNMPGEDVRPFQAGEWQLVVGYVRYLRCPFCGFETRNSTQPVNEGWKCCPGCGNKCSGGGVMMARNRKKSRENKKAGFRIEGRSEYRNGEGYADPTAYEAIRKAEKKEKAT